jgi:hypothetical protein
VFSSVLHKIRGQKSVVGTATLYGLEVSGLEPQWGREFLHSCRPNPRPTQTPVRLVTRLFKCNITVLDTGCISLSSTNLTRHICERFGIPYGWSDMVGLIWLMRQAQHVDVWIFNSRTWGRKKLLQKRCIFSVLVFLFWWWQRKKSWNKCVKIGVTRLFPGVNLPGRRFDHPPHLEPMLKKE